MSLKFRVVRPSVLNRQHQNDVGYVVDAMFQSVKLRFADNGSSWFLLSELEPLP